MSGLKKDNPRYNVVTVRVSDDVLEFLVKRGESEGRSKCKVAGDILEQELLNALDE